MGITEDQRIIGGKNRGKIWPKTGYSGVIPGVEPNRGGPGGWNPPGGRAQKHPKTTPNQQPQEPPRTTPPAHGNPPTSYRIFDSIVLKGIYSLLQV